MQDLHSCWMEDVGEPAEPIRACFILSIVIPLTAFAVTARAREKRNKGVTVALYVF